jgi:hypothetical protein
MTEKKMDKVDNVEKAKLQALEQENIILKQKLEDAEKIAATQPLVDNIMTEMRKIRERGQAKSHTITVREMSDHKRISLWRKDGKQIGPLHPDNAIQTLNRFANLGVMLSVDKPTLEQIEKYKQTVEYKKRLKWEQDRRSEKDKSRAAGQMEKLTEAIAKLAGVNAKEINYLLTPDEAGKK